MKLSETPAALWVAACLMLLPVSIIFIEGCASSPVQTTIKSEQVLIVSVDTGMQIWHDYVVAHLTDGKVTQKQIDTVRNAYNDYYAAQQAAKAIIEKVLTNVSTNQADVDVANAAVDNAKQALLSILNQYIK